MINIKTLASGSKGNCYRVSDGETDLLLECGVSFPLIREWCKFKLSEISGCLITHEHQDHCVAVNKMLAAGVQCYMTEGTINFLGLNHHRLTKIKEKQDFKIGSWTIKPFKTEHDATEPVGFLLVNKAGEKLIYVTDSYYLRYYFSGLTHIMLEVNYDRELLDKNTKDGLISKKQRYRILKSHFSLDNAITFLQANDLSLVREIHLLHLSDGNSNAYKFKAEIEALTGIPVYIAAYNNFY